MMKKNGRATDLLDAIIAEAPQLPLRIERREYRSSDLDVQNVYPAGSEHDGVVQVREYGDESGTTYSWANYIALSGNALPLLLEVVNAALESDDERVREKAEAASRQLVKIVQQIAEESRVEVPESSSDDYGRDPFW